MPSESPSDLGPQLRTILASTTKSPSCEVMPRTPAKLPTWKSAKDRLGLKICVVATTLIFQSPPQLVTTNESVPTDLITPRRSVFPFGPIFKITGPALPGPLFELGPVWASAPSAPRPRTTPVKTKPKTQYFFIIFFILIILLLINLTIVPQILLEILRGVNYHPIQQPAHDPGSARGAQVPRLH